ncbi:MAG: hypothetical protein IJ960_00015 [Oscillospiraceae bacterium]|nr:hypothetical protein [Oscillospiraceae bacterium]
MKKLVNLLLALVLILSMTPAVYADVIYIPEDSFLDGHWQECTEVRRGYVARTEVTVYESPKSGKVEGKLSEGEGSHVYYTWTDEDGILWGYLEHYVPDANAIMGWVPMAYMALQYDHISFAEDYGDQFQYLDKWLYLDDSYLGQVIYFWNYPGSDYCDSWEAGDNADYLPAYDVIYIDAQGHRWGYVGYHMGFRDVWLCVSDPTADFATLYPNGSPEVEITEPLPPLPQAEIKPGSSPMPILIGGGAVLCVVVTAVVLLKKKKNG